MLGKSHFPNLWNGVKGVHVPIVEIKSGINLWRRMIPRIEHVQRKSLLKFAKIGRPFKLEQQRLNVPFDRGLRSIPQIRVAQTKVRVEICEIEYSPHISTVQMEVKIRSTIQNSFANPKCREGNFWWDCGKCKFER